ncbi:hypothetical protein [Candidatus Nitrosocosmicus sp. T]
MTISLIPNYSPAQAQWKTFNQEDGIYSLQLPSNWTHEKIPSKDNEFSFLFDDSFIYPSKDSSYAKMNFFGVIDAVNEDSKASAEFFADIMKDEDGFKVLKPIDCESLTINNTPACTVTITFKPEGETNQRIITFTTLIDPMGNEYSTMFIASDDLFNKYLPIAEYMTKTIKLDSKSILDNRGVSNSDSSDNPFSDSSASNSDSSDNPFSDSSASNSDSSDNPFSDSSASNSDSSDNPFSDSSASNSDSSDNPFSDSSASNSDSSDNPFSDSSASNSDSSDNPFR